MSLKLDAYIRQIKTHLPGAGSDIDKAAENASRNMELIGASVDLTLMSEAVRILKEQIASTYEKRHSIFKSRPDWYSGPDASSKRWIALEELLTSKGWKKETIDSIDRSSTEIVSLLSDPGETQFTTKGLVVGYVQSGKTANMTAVIAKAADAGYNMIIILAGLTNKLRRQTQGRLEDDLVASYPDNWDKFTRKDDDGDFVLPPNKKFLAPTTDVTSVLVVKKNVTPLRNLLRTIEKSSPAVKKQLKVLIIDDECDQASVNASNNEFSPSSINNRIREILGALPCVNYVGYTATPFANVLIDPSPQANDLYPADFITALEKPDGYFGAEELFGRSGQFNDDPPDDGIDVIRKIPEEDLQYIRPQKAKDSEIFQPEMARSLEDAVLYFICAAAARLVRGHENKHITMLVHTSVRNVLHEKVMEAIRTWIKRNNSDIANCSGIIGDRMKDLWGSEHVRHARTSEADFQDIEPLIPEVLNSMKYAVENGISDSRLEYEGEPGIWLVVGGTVLSRGLTLEGLTTSYFTRSTSQYDTLMQMGRWFGFRPGYDDLPRIWTTEDLSTSFRALALVELEIRDEIDQYSSDDVSPMDVATRIRQIPGMAITAKAKMRSAVQCSVSYEGRHVETIRFERSDEEVISSNWSAAEELINSLEVNADKDTTSVGRVVYRSARSDAVLRFLKRYSIHNAHRSLSSDSLTGFVSQAIEKGFVDDWNVAVILPRDGKVSRQPLGRLGHVSSSIRSRLTRTDKYADVKALISKADLLSDCPGASPVSNKPDEIRKQREEIVGTRTPLLLLYPIEAASEPKMKNSKHRVALDAVGDLIGVCIVFPGDKKASGDFWRVDLSFDVDDLEEGDSEAYVETVDDEADALAAKGDGNG